MWMDPSDPAHAQYRRDISSATHFLLTRLVPDFAFELLGIQHIHIDCVRYLNAMPVRVCPYDFNFCCLDAEKGVLGLGRFKPSQALHRKGINVRHLGLCHTFLV